MTQQHYGPTLFPQSYEDSRARFIRDVELLRPKWADTRLESYPLKNHPSLSIDYVWRAAQKENLIIITTAEHGIEGYVGSAMLKLFMDEFTPRHNPENTGLLLVHTIKQMGMQHWRKTNENSVDLNPRNFVYGKFDSEINPDFKTLEYLFTPQRPARSFFMESLSFWGRVIRALITPGISRVSTAALLGQHHTPKGFYYGGTPA